MPKEKKKAAPTASKDKKEKKEEAPTDEKEKKEKKEEEPSDEKDKDEKKEAKPTASKDKIGKKDTKPTASKDKIGKKNAKPTASKDKIGKKGAKPTASKDKIGKKPKRVKTNEGNEDQEYGIGIFLQSDSRRMSARARRNMERVEMLARPNSRRLRSLWDEKCAILPPERRDKIKSSLEEDYFLSPEQTEQYFQALSLSSRRWPGPAGVMGRTKDDKTKEQRQRQKWLVNFSAQVAYNLCDYIAKGNKEMLVSNRLRSIADVVLERVAEILGEPKPSRTHPGRLPRFMVAISDRIAVWIENSVYRADAYEPSERGSHEHIRLDAESPYVCK